MSEILTSDYVALSSCVYTHGLVPEGYDLVDYWDEAGFYGAAFSRLNTDDIVIAFRGTELNDPSDIEDDFKLILNMALHQTEYAYSFYQQVKKIYSNATITLTGHSLGGALAQLVAVLIARDEGIQIHAETFNAPGVSNVAVLYWNNFQHFNKFDIINYYNSSDLISNFGIHIGVVIKINPLDLYKKKIERGFSNNEEPADYLRKIYSFSNTHSIKFFKEYYEVEENSFRQIENEINNTPALVSNEQLPNANKVNEEEVPIFVSDDFIDYNTISVYSNTHMLEVGLQNVLDRTQIKKEETYNIYNEKEPPESFNKNIVQLQQQDDKFTSQKERFYVNYDSKFMNLSKDLDNIYNSSDSPILQMGQNLLNSFFKQDQNDDEEDNAIALQSSNGVSNNNFVPQYQYKSNSGQVSLQSGASLPQATVNVVNNLGVTLAAVSNTRWNGQQYVVEVALSKQS